MKTGVFEGAVGWGHRLAVGGTTAATAVVHGLAAVTRNRSDFANAGMRIVDPLFG